MADHLCYSEWDMVPTSLDQVAHLLAVLIQGQVEAYKVESESNVRTPFSRPRLKQMLQETGWHVATESIMDSTILADANWEIANCLRSSLNKAQTLSLPGRLRDLLDSEADVLREVAGRGPNRSLDSYAILAQRISEVESGN